MKEEKPALSIENAGATTRAATLEEVRDSETRSRLAEADIILLPRVPAEPPKGPAFASHTRELFRFLKAKLPTSAKVEVATETDEIGFIVLHGEIFDLGVLLVTHIGAPLLLSMLANYLSDALRNPRGRRESTVRCRVLIEEPDGRCSALDYDGPADTFEELMRGGMTRTTGGSGHDDQR